MHRMLILGMAFLLIGCSSTLKVYDSKYNEAKGVPINVPQLVEITSVTAYKVANGQEKYKEFCTLEETTSLEFMPLGERFYITFEPAAFGDGEFSVEFTDKGLVKSVVLNSKASAGAEQINSLLSTVLPYITSPKPMKETKSSIEIDETAQKLKDKYCLKSGTKIISIKKLEIK